MAARYRAPRSSLKSDILRVYCAKKRQNAIPRLLFFASERQASDNLILAAALSPAALRTAQRRANAGEIRRIHRGIYLECSASADDIAFCVRSNWQYIAGALVPGGVVSHLSAIGSGIQTDGLVTLTHPSQYRKTITLPGLRIVTLRGAGPLAGDLALAGTGLHWAGRTRMLVENLGRSAPSKAGRDIVEQRLIDILHASGERALNQIRDESAALAEALGRHPEAATLRSIIGALLGTHARGELRSKEGRLLSKGTPIDRERLRRFDTLAVFLRGAALPSIENKVRAGAARRNCAFIESYFSNYVEGTKFDIEEARQIVMNNKVAAHRPKDAHDILGVFRLAMTSPFRDNPPIAGEDFLPGLENWHADMLRERPEVNPGKIKLKINFAGTSRFVDPAMVRGTLEESSKLALSVPEGLARAIFYGFLVSEVHPFEDGNGRLSRLVMNAELTRVGMHRIIIPTLFHPEYVDCARALTRQDRPEGVVASIAKMARWCSQFDYRELDELIALLKKTNALEESRAQYKLLNLDEVGTR